MSIDIENALGDLARKGIDIKHVADYISGGGYGGTRQNAGNIGAMQGQTDYNYQQGLAQTANDRLTDQQSNMADRYFYRNESVNNARRQANLINDVAMADQTNRANAAANVLNSYNQARQTNANFLGQLATAGITQR